jgi:hypothetical protein
MNNFATDFKIKKAANPIYYIVFQNIFVILGLMDKNDR